MTSNSITWKGLIYYGEVFGFVLAWLIVFAVAANDRATLTEQSSYDRVAAIDTSVAPMPGDSRPGSSR